MKILQRLILPPASILLLMLSGFLLVRTRRNLGRLFIAAGFLLLYGLSTGPVSSALIGPLERGFRPVNAKLVKADVIVVLGGGTSDRAWLGLEPEPGEESVRRVVEAVRLHRALHVPMMITGGSLDPAQPGLSDANAMARTAMDLGVTEEDILIENRSRNTRESARAMKDLLKGGRIILVTSAYHLKRSVALFRKQGLEVVPAPAGFRNEQIPSAFFSYVPNAGNLSTSSIAVAEYLSTLWYSMTGDL